VAELLLEVRVSCQGEICYEGLCPLIFKISSSTLEINQTSEGKLIINKITIESCKCKKSSRLMRAINVPKLGQLVLI